MLEQQGNALTFLAFYTATKVGKTGITVTVDVYENTTAIVSGGSATELGGGVYYYTLSSGSVDANGNYIAIFKTTDATVDVQHIPSLWIVGRAWVNRVDMATSTVNTNVSSLPTTITTNVNTANETLWNRVLNYLGWHVKM